MSSLDYLRLCLMILLLVLAKPQNAYAFNQVGDQRVEVRIDCNHSDLDYEQTEDELTVTVLFTDGTEGSTTENFTTQGAVSGEIQVNSFARQEPYCDSLGDSVYVVANPTKSAIKEITISIDGTDSIFMDEIYIYTATWHVADAESNYAEWRRTRDANQATQFVHFGRDDGLGWCLSTDVNANFGQAAQECYDKVILNPHDNQVYVIVLDPGASTNLHITVTCVETTEAGEDEIYLSFTDGSRIPSGDTEYHDINDGQSWSTSRSILQSQTLTVSIWEYDTEGDRDFIGEVPGVGYASLRQSLTVNELTGDDGNYSISFWVDRTAPWRRNTKKLRADNGPESPRAPNSISFD